MKKILIAALLACSVCAFADEPAPQAEGAKTVRRHARGDAPRQQLTPEQRKERRDKFMAQMKARQDAIQAKVVAALQEAGLDEAKAKSTAEKIQQIYREGRPQRPQPGAGRPRPEAK